MTTQPEALRLADWLELIYVEYDGNGMSELIPAAAELRRLHEELQATERQVETLSDDLSRCSKLNQEWERVCDQHLRHIEKLKKRLAKAQGEQA